MIKLSSDDLQAIEVMNSELELIISQINAAKQFRVGDYLIMETGDWAEVDAEEEFVSSPLLNSYGELCKFKVVHVDSSGIGYIKEVNRNGVPKGLVGCLFQKAFINDGTFFEEYCDGPKYRLDPDYADHLILSEGTEYDPFSSTKDAAEIRKNTIDYNKENKIDTKTIKAAIVAFENIKVGETYWLSAKTSILITAIVDITVTRAYQRLYKTKTIKEITYVRAGKKNSCTMRPEDFQNKNLYRNQPRSLKLNPNL